MKTLLGALVRLFPAPFRARFGEAVVEHALLDWERDRRRGVVAGARSLASTVFDLGQQRARGTAAALLPRRSRQEGRKDHELRPERLGWGASPRAAHAAALARLRRHRRRDAGPGDRHDHRRLRRSRPRAALAAALRAPGTARVHRRHRARVGHEGRVRPGGRVLPPVPGRLEAGRGRRHLRQLHQHAAGRRAGRADPDGRGQPLALLDARGATRRSAACRCRRTRIARS